MRYQKGDKHPYWKGGLQNDHGYLAIYRPDHPNSTKRGIVKLHRYLYEKYHNCCLLKYTEIHHINGNILDNRKENLMALSKAQHTSITRKKDVSDRFCLICKGKTIKNSKGSDQWSEYNKGHICNKCYLKIYMIRKRLFRI